MFVKLLKAYQANSNKKKSVWYDRCILKMSFPWEIRKHFQDLRGQEQQIHFKEMKYSLSLSLCLSLSVSLTLRSPWNRLCSWADFMLESCPKYALTEGLWEWTQSCLLSHTCHHTHSQVLNCLRTLCRSPQAYS